MTQCHHPDPYCPSCSEPLSPEQRERLFPPKQKSYSAVLLARYEATLQGLERRREALLETIRNRDEQVEALEHRLAEVVASWAAIDAEIEWPAHTLAWVRLLSEVMRSMPDGELDQALSRISSEGKGAASDHDDDHVPCEVCGDPVLWGSRHHNCGRYAVKQDKRIAELEAEVERLKAKVGRSLLEAASANGDAAKMAEEVERLRGENERLREMLGDANRSLVP